MRGDSNLQADRIFYLYKPITNTSDKKIKEKKSSKGEMYKKQMRNEKVANR